MEGPMPRGGIRPLTESEFTEMTAQFPYYKGRWVYVSKALGQVETLIRRRGARTALELGVPLRPIVVGADAMDITAGPHVDPAVPMTIHDATQAPWPVGDKAYDVFIALQVFEHLRDRQREAFLEVRRIARHAVISLPIDWEMDDPTNCHHRIPEERVLSWFAPIVPDAGHRGQWRPASSPDLRLRGPAGLTRVARPAPQGMRRSTRTVLVVMSSRSSMVGTS